MATTCVRELTTDEQWDAAIPIVRQLWCDADEVFVRSWREEEGYSLFGLYATVERNDGENGRSDDARDDHGSSAATEATDASATEATDAGSVLVAVAGVSIQRVLHHVRHAWVHDFVVDEPFRDTGYGTDLLEFVERWARDRDCEALALATRLDNADARRFYEGRGMDRWGHVIETRL